MATTITVSHTCNAPPDRVFAIGSDFPNMAQHVDGITRVEMLTPGAIGVGTRFKETRMMFGKEATEVMEVTAFDPPRGYTLVAQSCGARYESRVTFEPDGAGTRSTIATTITPLSFMAKLMAPMAWLMSGMMKKCFLKDLESVARAAEGGAPVAAR